MGIGIYTLSTFIPSPCKDISHFLIADEGREIRSKVIRVWGWSNKRRRTNRDQRNLCILQRI